MRCYAVSELELDTLSRFSNAITISFSIAGAALGYGAEWYIEWREEPTQEAVTWIAACMFVATAFFLWGGFNWLSRGSVSKAIKGQAKDRP